VLASITPILPPAGTWRTISVSFTTGVSVGTGLPLGIGIATGIDAPIQLDFDNVILSKVMRGGGMPLSEPPKPSVTWDSLVPKQGPPANGWNPSYPPYVPPGAIVPEASTATAGALLLLPFGWQAIRKALKRK
jgi:hypothetical protein